jgi:hypothetical protein
MSTGDGIVNDGMVLVVVVVLLESDMMDEHQALGKNNEKGDEKN